MRHATPPTATRSAHGFTLVELLVVTAIILILAVLAIAGFSAMQQAARAKATQSLLGQLDGVITEFRAVNNGTPPPVASNTGNTVEQDFELLLIDLKNTGPDSSTVAILKTVRTEYFPVGLDAQDTTQRGEHIVDTWGHPIAFIGTDGVGSGGISDQPLRTAPYFGSPGPDGLWGVWTSGPDGQVPDEDAEDNLYSFNSVR